MSGCAILDSGIAARQNGKRLPCEVLQAENAKLREQIHWLKRGDILHVLTDQEYIDQCERERLMQVSIDALDKENAKLREDLEFERSENGWAREFLNRMGQKCGTKDCPSLVAYVTKLEAENTKLSELVDYMTPIAWYGASEQERDRMRELGVEVDA